MKDQTKIIIEHYKEVQLHLKLLTIIMQKMLLINIIKEIK